MTGVDWIIVGLLLLLALFGWAQGFVTGALALVGFALGAWLGTRLAGVVLPDGSRSPYAPAIGLVGALCVGAGFAAGFEGLGFRLRSRLTLPGMSLVDGLLGALLTALVGLGVVWIVGAIAVHSAGDLRYEVQRSQILSRLNKALPPSGPLLNALARFDPFPRIDGPEAQVAAPRAGIARDPDVEAAAGSVVKVLGTACGLGVEGSGWAAANGLVVTNAHVVAGQDDTRVLLRGKEPGLDATAVAFDARNDLAVLRVNGLRAKALPIAANPKPGTSAAVLGFPHNGPYDVRAARLGETRSTVTQDAYGRGPVQRLIASLRGIVRSGNSGGPMVDGRGRVVATIFAATTSGPRGGYGVPNSVVKRVLAGARDAVSTGPCAR
ncbi:MAG: MarP family serine protease [Solirubrobacteraceae bacterium]